MLYWYKLDLQSYLLLWQKKICFGFDRSKDNSKRKYFLDFVLVLPKQTIIVQVRVQAIDRD